MVSAMAEARWAFLKELDGARRRDGVESTMVTCRFPVGDANLLVLYPAGHAVREVPWVGNHVMRRPSCPFRVMGLSHVVDSYVRLPPMDGYPSLRRVGRQPLMFARVGERYTPSEFTDRPDASLHVVDDVVGLSLFRSVVSESFRYPLWSVRVMFPRVPQNTDRATPRLHVAISDRGQPVGAVASVRVRQDSSVTHLVVSDMCVVSSHRRKGLGQWMLHNVLQAEGRAGDIAVLTSTRAGRPLYDKTGFVEGGTFDTWEYRRSLLDRWEGSRQLRVFASEGEVCL